MIDLDDHSLDQELEAVTQRIANLRAHVRKIILTIKTKSVERRHSS